jgi:phosphate transport system substrate-binding protein
MNMRKVLVMMVALLVAISFVAFAGGRQEAAGGEASQLSGSVKIAGSSTVYPVSTAIAEEFSKIHPDVEVPVQSTGTGGGFKNFFSQGKTDINNASRTIKDGEVEMCKENGITPVQLQVATDAITIVVNPEADWVDDISVEELAQIWRPENPAQKWSDVRSDWPDEEIELYGPTAASGTFDYFTEEIIGEGGASRDDYQKTEQDNTIVQAVSGSEYAMGYFGMAYYLENKSKVKALAVNGVKPSIETAKSGEYTPLSRPLFIYVAQESVQEKPQVRAFVEFYLEQIDTDLIKQVGYVPMTTADKNAMLEKFNEMVE